MADKSRITTLGEFLHQSGAHYRLFDMGRRVTKISAEVFAQFEQAAVPYPTPFQRTALFAVLFWHPQQADKHYVWFLRFPLDEQGLLLQAARDEFLTIVLERVGESMLAAADGRQIEGALKDSPYSFNPREDKMAAFNAQATRALALPASSFYTEAWAYFQGQRNWQDWQQLGMQGVADVAIRLQDQEDVSALIRALPTLPTQPFQMLATFLEHSRPSVALTEAFAQHVSRALEQTAVDIATVCACLRAVSNSQAQGLLRQMVEQVLAHESSRHIEVLAIIVGRCWSVLADPQTCRLLLEKLALNEAGYDGFSHLLADLVYLPAMRGPVMAALRHPQRSEALSQYVGQMFGTTKH